jgi:1,4-alpha-glucan branching enzyme
MQSTYPIITIDPYLKPYNDDIILRMSNYESMKKRLLGKSRFLKSVTNTHTYYGFHATRGGWVYREWAPHAESIALIGDFNNWDDSSHLLTSLGNGNWELQVKGSIPHNSKVRLRITADGRSFERIPLYCKRVVQNPETLAFDGVIWNPSKKYRFLHKDFTPQHSLRIYECHIGMSGQEDGINTFKNFTQEVLPRIHRLGYNTIQIMAIMEHPYYGSFGYQVTNLFAVSSRFGTPEEFKELVDTAHGLGIAVIMDIVHSHVSKNTVEGLSEFDGTDYQFCHGGGKGEHPAWGTRLYNFTNPEVVRFLLSNVNYWLTEYQLDGFRFDGVTSMLYHHHGLGTAFDHYDKYFSMDTDIDAITYLQLAAELTKQLNPHAILIAEDMSGMPGMCLPLEKGGIGFDYRLGMGLPDHFIKMMKMREEDWRMDALWHELTTRRPQEKVIGYTESHDQALVGDKTLIFWMADKEMYEHMHKNDQNYIVDRAIAYHKMFRLITCAAGGEGYLNFMGNEFGHPEWVDFPREGNNWSYHYARRQWHLADNPELKYQYLQNFDEAMIKLCNHSQIAEKHAKLIQIHEDNKLIVFEKGHYLFLFNFHGQYSYLYKQATAKDYQIVLHSAWQRFGGFVNEQTNEGILTDDYVAVDCRTAIVLKKKTKKKIESK